MKLVYDMVHGTFLLKCSKLHPHEIIICEFDVNKNIANKIIITIENMRFTDIIGDALDTYEVRFVNSVG